MADSAVQQAKASQKSEVEKDSSIRHLILDGVIKAFPTICVLIFAVWLVSKFAVVIETKLAPNLKEIKAFGVELTFAERNLEKLRADTPKLMQGDPRPPLSGAAKTQILRRTSLLGSLLRNSRILWVDDHPENNVLERNFLQSIAISVDSAQDNSTAYKLLDLQRLNGTPYDLIISDYAKDNEPGAPGLTLLQEVRNQGYSQAVVFYTTKKQNKPDNAFALTYYPDDLLNYVFDALERSNTMKSDFAMDGPAASR